MGTDIEVRIEAAEPRPLLEEVVARLRVYEHRFSANDPASELGEVNCSAGERAVSVHPELFELIALGLEHSLAPGSMLNVAIGPLVQLWRVGFADARVPTPSEIETALELTDPAQVDLDERDHQVFLRRAGMKLDLGALAKGYIADCLVEYVHEEAVRSALVNLGGNVLTYGPSPTQPDGCWRVGLRHPLHPEGVLGAVTIDNGSVVTSGVYQRTLTEGGRTFHHILDPATGYPVETDVVSLSVLSPRSVDGEIWTSRLFGKPVQEVLHTLSELPGVEGLTITRDRELRATTGLSERLRIGAAAPVHASSPDD